jgi:pyruvate,orthophosphate dikinase
MAVLIQAMVFGNAGARSGSGVGFTRSPVTGDDGLYLDFLFNAQGEDVVSGRHAVTDSALLPSLLPDVWNQLQTAKRALEQEFLDMQDFEFTVDEGQLFFLQTRSGKRTPWAALRIAVDLVREGVVDRSTALRRLEPYDLDNVVRVAVRPGPDDLPVGQAVPAGIGAATGEVVFDAKRAQERGAERDVVLVRSELDTDDIAGLSAAVGILTTFGGRTSHAAVVARHLGKTCLVACGDLRVEDAARVCSIGDRLFREGDLITIDGETGLVYAGRVRL